MKVFISDNAKVTQFELPTKSEEFFTYNYTISNSKVNCLITFEKKDSKWYIKSNGIVNIYNTNVALNSAEIFEYSNYKLKIIGYNSFVNIYFSTFEEEKTYQLDISNLNKITIGNNNSCNIFYFNNEVAQTQSMIAKVNNEWIFKNVEDIKYYTYINNYRIINTKLKTGDIIFINGLKVIWMQEFIVINNPNNRVKVTGLQAYKMLQNIDNTNIPSVSDEEQNYELYKEEDYFFHTPRIREIFEEETITIDQPPNPINEDETPWYLKIGASLTMGASSLIMGINIINRLKKDESVFSLFPEILMLSAMLIGTMMLPKLLDRWKKKQNAKYEKERVEKYGLYLEEKEKEISQKTKQIIQIWNDNNLNSTNCKIVAKSPSNRNFWSREIISNDFLNVRLGLGILKSPITIQCQEKKFELKTDHLVSKVYELAEKYKNIENVPITISLLEKRISAFICNGINKYDYFKNIMVQLIALHSGADLKIVVFTNEDNESEWEYAKFLPHCWSEDKSFRYFATTNEEIKSVSAKLEDEFKQRNAISEGKENLKDKNDEVIKIDSKKIYSNFSCYYLIICDNYKNNVRIPIIDDILNKKDKNLGFSFVLLSNTLKNLPVQCDTFIEVGPSDGCILSRDISTKNQKKFFIENDSTIDLRDICKTLLNVPLVPKEGISSLPSSLSFLDMYGVSKIEQLNIVNRWKTNNPVMSLSAPIGVYANGDTFKLDLHEKAHGPHGLIAGTTGSGKSEFIISYILSMCVNYHPYEVQFVLIDYKGGGLAGAFENRELGTRIPHLAGTITNLDTASMNRTLVSIQSELKRRQQIFNQTRDSLGEGTVDIYKYQKFYREGIVKEPLPHLFIISDEFAELKAQQPEFMDELISTARIGRSLGVHLILATQKPSGVVNDQIWSNSKFKICLKVQDKSDSMEILKKPDAAYIKETGRFYLQVGNDDLYDKGQSGWSGAKYYPSDKIIKKMDDSISFINNTGEITKSTKEVKVDVKKDLGEQLTNIVKYVSELGEKEHIMTTKLWLDPIPEKIYISNLKKKYNYKPESYIINPIIGEYDSPKTQTQKLLTYNFNNQGNIMIAGKQGSGKENLLTTIILSSVIDHTPDEVNFYIIDCGTEVLRIFQKMPHVGEIAYQEDKELITEIFEMIDDEIEYRKSIMADYGGIYEDYISESGNKLPVIIVIINNYDVFLENYSRIEETLSSLYRDGPRYGINFILTEITPNTIRNRISQYFSGKFILQQNNPNCYRNDFDAPRGLVPTPFFGRGLAVVEQEFYEFQTAILVPKNETNKFVREATETYNKAYTSHARKIPIMPEIVYDVNMYKELSTLSKVPIGYSTKTKEISYYDFSVNQFNQIVCAGMDDEKMSFLFALSKMISKIDGVKVKIIDFVKAVDKELDNIEVYSDDYDSSIISINNEIIKNKSNSETTVYIVLGIGMYKSKMSEQGQAVLNRLFENVTPIENVKFILVDVLISFRTLLTEEWYQKNTNNLSGIWLDADPTSQIIINTPSVSIEERKINFPQIAFQIVNNKHTIIKHMVESLELVTEEGQSE